MNTASLIEAKPKSGIPALTPGDTVKVSIKVVEGDKERIQVFRGVVIRLRRGVAGPHITVRRVTYGVGVERTFPLYSPRVEKVEVLQHGKTRRAKLYYLRGLSAKASRIKEKRVSKEKEALLLVAGVEPEKAPEPEPEPVPEAEPAPESKQG